MSRREADTNAAGYGQPGWQVRTIIAGNAGRPKKRRKAGAPKRHTLVVLGPKGKEARYDISTLRGLRVQQGDRLVYHQGRKKRKGSKRKGFFSLDEHFTSGSPKTGSDEPAANEPVNDLTPPPIDRLESHRWWGEMHGKRHHSHAAKWHQVWINYRPHSRTDEIRQCWWLADDMCTGNTAPDPAISGGGCSPLKSRTPKIDHRQCTLMTR